MAARARSPLDRLRALAVGHTLFAPTSLDAAIERLGFVQADPIRAPAAAQDLILRHRVDGYRAGDLDRAYPSLAVEEEYLYAYGFVPRALRGHLQPRPVRALTRFERRVLDAVREAGGLHPRELEPRFGARRVTNAWGGQSRAGTRALDHLQYAGHLRVVRRESGVRVYAPSPPHRPAAPRERLDALILAVARVLAPVPERTLRANLRRFAHLGRPRAALDDLVRSGALERITADGADYLVPPGAPAEPAPRVRLLAPFDPIVWDRRRFEHLWQWRYRFEAYTPVNKRVRGYYALPLLWGDRVVGWGNAAVTDGRLDVKVGFVTRRPSGRAFAVELDAEIARLEEFLRGYTATGR